MNDTDNIDNPSHESISDSDWAQRRLCPDGNCIGVIGPDGRCKECGRPGDEDRATSPRRESTAPSGEPINPETSDTVAIPPGRHEDADTDHWANRRLCPDGNCIGVIGPDGRCKECGRLEEDR